MLELASVLLESQIPWLSDPDLFFSFFHFSRGSDPGIILRGNTFVPLVRCRYSYPYRVADRDPEPIPYPKNTDLDSKLEKIADPDTKFDINRISSQISDWIPDIWFCITGQIPDIWKNRANNSKSGWT